MTKAQALAAARKKWGARAIVQDCGRAVTRERREQAQALLTEHRANRPDPVTREWRKRSDELLGQALGWRFLVGYMVGNAELGALGFSVRGSGDSWEEACHKAGLV